MKVLMLLSIAATLAAVAMCHRQRSSTPRTFVSVLNLKLRSMRNEVSELKQKVHECCNPSGNVESSLYHAYKPKNNTHGFKLGIESN